MLWLKWVSNGRMHINTTSSLNNSLESLESLAWSVDIHDGEKCTFSLSNQISNVLKGQEKHCSWKTRKGRIQEMWPSEEDRNAQWGMGTTHGHVAYHRGCHICDASQHPGWKTSILRPLLPRLLLIYSLIFGRLPPDTSFLMTGWLVGAQRLVCFTGKNLWL